MNEKKFYVDFKNNYWLVVEDNSKKVFGKFTMKKDAYEYIQELL